MAILAIKGHATRCKEVIEILEMLGGSNPHNYSADCDSLCFYIGKDTNSIYYDWVRDYYENGNTLVFTLEEFLEKYPHKVGDKVNFSDSNTPFTISRMWWDSNASELICTLEEQDIDISSVDLQPYKEEAMEEKGTLVKIDLTRELCIANEVEVILGDYEFVLKDGKTYFVKKKPQYPKTYEECAKVLLDRALRNVIGHKGDLIVTLQKLLVCRDAYWKIAGDWKPNWKKADERKYCIVNTEGNITNWVQKTTNKILAFPTEEMRDAFYGNFNELIEECKELL